ALGGLGWLTYGAHVEANKLVLERHRLRLPLWPANRDGFRIALLADLHVRDEYSVALCKRAVQMAIDSEPDAIVIAGDFVGYWKLASPGLLGDVLTPLRDHFCVAVPGNHDYWSGDAALLEPICGELGINLLRNEAFEHDGIGWVGVDSANANQHDPLGALIDANQRVSPDSPMITLWHEPDMVDELPDGTALMLAGHSHGGQWQFPWGWTPMSTRNGKKYVSGFYPEARTPLYVSRGIGTTGPPARFGALAEVSILELYHV
ncbi:MAG: metallophosphoesterase, partial [Fimbriimonadaceae bacterium]